MLLEGRIMRDKGGIESRRRYAVEFKSRKRAINWLLRKLEREHPGCYAYEATIIDRTKEQADAEAITGAGVVYWQEDR